MRSFSKSLSVCYMTSTVPGKGYTVCSFIDSPNKYLSNSYYIPKNPGDTTHSFIHSFNKQFLGVCYVLQAAPCFLSLQPHSQPHPNQSQLLLALAHLHALALVPEMPSFTLDKLLLILQEPNSKLSCLKPSPSLAVPILSPHGASLPLENIWP